MKKILFGLIILLIATTYFFYPGSQQFSSVEGQSSGPYKDIPFPATVSAPTGQKPQSKLWYNDNTWWGVLFNSSSGKFEIYSLNWTTQTWSTTGTLVDDRPRSSADVLWTGTQLYIASAIAPTALNPINYYIFVKKYQYDPILKIYKLISTSTLWNGAVEAVVIDIEPAGTLWATFTYSVNSTDSRSVYISHTDTNNFDFWIPPYVLPVDNSANLAIDDISTLIAYNGKVGVLWSNQTTQTFYFAYHTDGAGDSAVDWIPNPPQSDPPKYADDHLNIKSLQADPFGQLYAVVKTSKNEAFPGSSKPLILLLILDNATKGGTWSRMTVSTVADNHTRPIVLIDTQNKQLYVFMTRQYPGQLNGAIYYKQLNLDNGTQFPAGLGTPFIEFSGPGSPDSRINNATSTKQNLTGITDLVVVASDDTERFYYHNVIDLPHSPPPSPAFSVFLPLITR